MGMFWIIQVHESHYKYIPAERHIHETNMGLLRRVCESLETIDSRASFTMPMLVETSSNVILAYLEISPVMGIKRNMPLKRPLPGN
jgi:hypothetical protein